MEIFHLFFVICIKVQGIWIQNRQSEPAGGTRRRTMVRREVKNVDNQKYKLKGTPLGVPSFIKNGNF